MKRKKFGRYLGDKMGPYKMKFPKKPPPKSKIKVITIRDLQRLPVDLGSIDGGVFAEICNRILEGDVKIVVGVKRLIRSY